MMEPLMFGCHLAELELHVVRAGKAFKGYIG